VLRQGLDWVSLHIEDLVGAEKIVFERNHSASWFTLANERVLVVRLSVADSMRRSMR